MVAPTPIGGPPGSLGMMCPDDATCRQTTVSVSSHARHTGSHQSLWMDGKPRLWGISGRVTATKPRSALRRISAAAKSGSLSQVMPMGMMRSG